MKRQDAYQLLAYVGVSVLSVGMAFMISLKFLGGSSAQEGEGEPQSMQEDPPPPAPDLGVPVEAVGVPTESAQPGVVEIETFLEPFIYDVVNRRDPFLPYAEYIPSESGDGGPSRPLTQAQKFAIEELKLVGVLWDVKEPKAMFMDPENEVLTLGRDESIGNRNGYIATIREGEVVVVEAIRKRGDVIYRTKVLRIER